MKKNKNVPKNDVLDLLEVGPLPAEANLQLADPELVSLYKRYSKRCIYLFDDIDDSTMRYVKWLLEWEREDDKNNIPLEDRKRVTIFINSYGGQIDSCLALCSVMKSVNLTIQTINMFAAASAAGLILMSGTKGHRYCMENSFCLIHQGSSGGGGVASFSQLEAQQSNYRKLVKMMENLVLNNTTIDAKEYAKIKSKENYYYWSDQISKGIVDKKLENISDIL